MNYKQGDLLAAFEVKEVSHIAIQENCEGLSYFAGISKAIHSKYPELTEKHIKACSVIPFGKIMENNGIFSLYSQYYRGAPSNRKGKQEYFDMLSGQLLEKEITDDFETRCQALAVCLSSVSEYKIEHLGLPLITSALFTCKVRKQGLSDLDYFKKYIAPIVERELKNITVTVYYL